MTETTSQAGHSEAVVGALQRASTLAAEQVGAADPPHGASESDTEEWTMVIRPHRGWFDLKLVELWRCRDLVALFVRRDFVAQYKQTILGPAWYIVQPLLSTIVFTIVFGNIAKLSTDGLPKMLFYLAGNVMWLYFSGCLTAAASTFTANAGIFGKVYFSRLAIPVSQVISKLVQFGIQFVLFLGFMAYFAIRGADVTLTFAAFLLPVLIVLMAGMSLGLGMIFSAMTSKYRDLSNLLTYGVRLLMYGAPVIYPLSTIPEKYRLLILANPITPIIETFRYGFLGAGEFSWLHLGYSALCTLTFLFIGAVVFARVERTFMDTV